ncbi:uncharacterized protein EAF02_010832 [Botrytis sinoallii]|uniref:uncharacterized protein n=1 Tax=Botrytis sinoallii TaxID=1463999 RepID=UPI001901E94B|nr:uncharacterized protein EAF02_010832 [Botrytis sinoallii]KAF7860598.1 hypothetical protein EAF02_010832 [Botrytis sinoallii]
MKFFSFALLAAVCKTVLAAPALAPFSTFSDVTIFTPGANWTDPGVLYARTVELPGGVLLATWENYSPEPPLVYFPIFKSTDGGESWKHISNITDQVNGWGLRYQPFLYYMTEKVGKYPAGTILATGNSIPTDLSETQIDVYASLDHGYTWEFVSTVANGGAAVPDNGVPAIWEPFLLTYKGQIVLYYSDQRDPLYGQKLVHTVSSDLLTWGAIVDDVHYSTYTARPGMTTISKLPNGKYIMTYEYGGGPTVNNTSTYLFPVYYRISSSPLTFLSAPGTPLITNNGIQPTGSPYNVWSPTGGANGTIIVSSGGRSEVFVNRALGAADAWKTVATPEGTSYTRHLRVLDSNKNHLLIAGGGILPPSTTNKVTVSVIDITKGLAAES